MTRALHPGQIFAGYRIDGVAGRGGMGVVYRARQVALDRTVALKLIAPELAGDASFRERLERESKLLASIDHPNVITVYEAGEADGQLFMSMRYVEGLDLHSLIAAEGPLPPERAARIVADVAAGLDAAHAGGLVHRDVKPANVLIERRNATERVYLSDFGLTNKVSLTDAITHGGQWVGTLDYVAPEQIQAAAVDARSDVYALGCVLFQTLTGRVPFIRDTDAAKLYAHLNDPAPSALELRPELPAQVDHVVARAMAKDPAQRYRSAGDLGRAAIAAVGGEAPTRAAGRSVATGAAATVRRRSRAARAVWAAMVLAAGAAAVGAIALTRDHAGEQGAGDVAVPSARVDRVSLGKRAVTGYVAAKGDDAYVLDRSARKVVKVDGGSGQVEGRITVGESPADIQVEASDERLWVVNRADRTVSELDVASGRQVGRRIRVQREATYLAVLRDEVVVLSQRKDGASLLRVRKKTHRRVGKIVELGGFSTDLTPTRSDGVAATTAFPAVLSTYAPQLKRPNHYDLKHEGGVAEVVIDDAGVAWVVFSVSQLVDKPKVPAGTPLPGVVLRVDPQTGKRIGTPIKVGRSPNGIAIDRGVVWVPSKLDESVTRIDARSARVIGAPIAVGPNNGAVAASDGLVWVGGEKDLIRIRPR